MHIVSIKFSLRALWAPFLCLAIWQAADAAQAQEEPTQASSTVIYDQAYFAQFNPITLEDMIRNIPGGGQVISSLRFRGGNRRGFGSAGAPILLNGRRMSGKTNDMATTLARIQASQVDRIELIRGNAEGLDIQNQGILYNVILKAGAENSSSSFFELGINIVRETPIKPELLLSHSGRRGPLEFGLSYQYDTRPQLHNTDENVLEPDRTPREFRSAVTRAENSSHKVTGNLGYEFEAGTRVRFNGLFVDRTVERARLEDQFLVAPDLSRTLFAVEDSLFRTETREWELGGDIEHSFGSFGTLKALFVLNRKINDDNITQDLIENSISDRFFTSVADFDEDETIFRLSMTSQLGQRHSLEYGGEGAFNRLDRTFSFDFEPLENAKVSEDRFEIFAIHNFAIADNLNLQSSLTGEFSTISQTREGVTNSTSFEFLKPRFELRFDLTPADQIRMVAARTVSQLNLNDFVASRNVDDDTINFGNPNLSPQQTWKFTMGYERRFANDGGSMTVELFYEDISDHIDKILVDTDSSGTGNVGKARRFGVEIETSLRFGFLGFPTAVLTSSYRYQNSRVRDPFSGLNRIMRFTTPHWWNFEFRHDIENSDFTYGFSVHRRSEMLRQDLTVIEDSDFKRHIFLFVEYNITNNIKLQGEVNHALNDTKFADKTFFVGSTASGVIERFDLQTTKSNIDSILRIQATF